MAAALLLIIVLIVSHTPDAPAPDTATSTVSPDEAGKIILKRR